MRILALDHGAARIGCAICDPSETIARPLDVVEPPSVDAVAGLVGENEVEMIVVGLPVTLGGEQGSQAQVAIAFADELRSAVAVPVETYDERLTTRLAESSARAGAEAPADALAAAHLLESFLQSRARASGK